MSDQWTTKIYNAGEYVEVLRNDQSVVHIRLSSVAPNVAGRYKAAAATELSGKEVAVSLTTGETLVFDTEGQFLRQT